MTSPNQSLLDWLDDLCVRFIVNLPHEELQSVERICFQIEEAQWFYEDFIRPLDPRLPSMNLRMFSQRMFQHCPLFAGFSEDHFLEAFQHFLQYKTRVPVRGAIMLNHDMTHAVLVKGWKKGAKWSFPRGKINKDEPDLECAIREVYEETGYDLKDAGLVPPESEMKSIPVNMREQSMLLYVFRGVPMDTYFEPRTRKEISKIDWYKLSDLPTLKRKNQVQQGTGQDLIKDNSFYMVAPFLGPLKAWIKTQRKQDRQRAHAGSHLVPPPTAGVTDTEGLEADLGETTADEAAMPERITEEASFAALVAKLGRTQRASDTLPEVSTHAQTQGVADPAAELKRLLSVGIGFPSQPQAVEARQTVQESPPNPLLAMLHGSNRPAPPPDLLPRTPFEQILPTPQPPRSPHGQHHTRTPHLGQMPPPPPFPFHHQQEGPFHGQQHHHVPPQHHNGFPPPTPNQFISPPPPQHGNPIFPTHAPNVQQSFSASGPPPPYQRTGDPQFAQTPQFPRSHGPAIPPASKLPPPKLTAHTLGLLNAFKVNEKPAISSPIAQAQLQSSQATPITTRPPPLQRQPDAFVSPPPVQNSRPYAPSPPAFQSPPPVANFEPIQPKPRNAHQDSLLNLFRSPSTTAASPVPSKTPELPVELSAYPSTPGNMKSQTAVEAGPPMPDMHAKPNLLNAFGIPQKPGLTTATIRGPVNAPDFDTVKKNAQHPLNGNSRGPSPSTTKPEPKMFVPQQILRRESSVPRTIAAAAAAQSRSLNASPATVLDPATPFKPQILKRRQHEPIPTSTAHAQGLLNLFKTQSHPQPEAVPTPAPAHTQGLLNLFKNQTSLQPEVVPAPAPPSRSPAPPGPVPVSFDHQHSIPTDQKSALLSLFGKPSASFTASPTQTARSPLMTSATSPIPPARSPQPPTPKTFMSGVISPVSPLPGSQVDSPAQLNSRSRISSIGDSIPPSVVIPPTNAPTSFPQLPLSQQSNGFGTPMDGSLMGSTSASISELGLGIDKGKSKTGMDSGGKSPVDKSFLLGFLNDVARKGR
ncbi:mRNA-decapping enzyme subunit 2 [Didymosphaeria variabile]|uniref:mRNA-decapping enzyme subunit 2 n=1 Tax=Didymosphaeria variabile TaxID=1932322 RepID=A0A9W9CAA3_9PLEO|nr:mRNA-decapping enzyme subunit 2 [Didymosphaeria variabile]KAJ4352195.1 mRNA-decapping enzyme subunit 2 [Didymosphaeria variabile]